MSSQGSLSLQDEKLAQAVAILNELDLDCWLTFVRETTEAGDTVVPIILDQSLTWQSALIVTRGGERIAIVGSHEQDAVKSAGVWHTVVPYVQSIREPLRSAIQQSAPAKIAINYSVDNVKSDGLSHGMYLLLCDYLGEYASRFVSADAVITRLRGRKTPQEVARMRAAIRVTDELFDMVSRQARVGMTERSLSDMLQAELTQRNLEPAWDRRACPIVNTGPLSMAGHGFPSSTLSIQPGNLLHLDFGVRQNQYCSDIQRCWYVPQPGETAPPASLQRAFDAVVRSIDAAAAALRPGVACWQVDAAARATLVAAGYPEYQHATGHHVGRSAHDGGGVLGPRWERYGRTPEYLVEPGNVFTLELGIDNADGRGYLGLEEMVLVTEQGCEWLTRRQTRLPLLAPG